MSDIGVDSGGFSDTGDSMDLYDGGDFDYAESDVSDTAALEEVSEDNSVDMIDSAPEYELGDLTEDLPEDDLVDLAPESPKDDSANLNDKAPEDDIGDLTEDLPEDGLQSKDNIDDLPSDEKGDIKADDLSTTQTDGQAEGLLDNEGIEGETIEEFLRYGEMDANTTYERNGYTYETDDHGRVTEVYGDLHLGESYRTGHQTEVGHMGVEGDEGGHLVGARFEGSPEGVNLVPQDMHLNRSDWKMMENEWATALEEGKEVTFDTSLGYDGDDSRPTDFIVTYMLDGEPHVRHFPNERGAEPEDLV